MNTARPPAHGQHGFFYRQHSELLVGITDIFSSSVVAKTANNEKEPCRCRLKWQGTYRVSFVVECPLKGVCNL